KSLVDFLPEGWSIQEQVSGDLNGDGVPDIAAILIHGNPGSDPSEAEDDLERALIILLGRGNGKFIPAGTNDKIIHCEGCGGVHEMVGISIEKGVIVVTQWSGSREFAIETWRFRYDPKTQRFVLIGSDVESGDGMRGTGTVTSFNYLTGLKITETYRHDKNERKITTSTKREKGPRKTPFIEDVKLDY
ncbi:MAG: FG-GAP repeat protein, partial [Syntrophobacteraceae bacterium]